MKTPASAKNKQEKKLLKQRTEQLRSMEQKASRQAPGVMDLIKLYGDYEAATKQAEAYFSLLNPTPIFSTTNTSGT